jgi:hypothetical protein
MFPWVGEYVMFVVAIQGQGDQNFRVCACALILFAKHDEFCFSQNLPLPLTIALIRNISQIWGIM